MAPKRFLEQERREARCGASTLRGGSACPPPAFADEVTLKLWSRADRSGPLRSGNIVKAARPGLNASAHANTVGPERSARPGQFVEEESEALLRNAADDVGKDLVELGAKTGKA